MPYRLPAGISLCARPNGEDRACGRMSGQGAIDIVVVKNGIENISFMIESAMPRNPLPHRQETPAEAPSHGRLDKFMFVNIVVDVPAPMRASGIETQAA